MKSITRAFNLMSAMFFIVVGGIVLIFKRNNYKPIYKGVRYFLQHESYQISLRTLMNDPQTKELIDSRYREGIPVNWNELKALPPQTLGYEFAKFMNNPDVTPINKLPESRDKINPELDYLRARIRLIHDIHHVVCGYGADEIGEMGISAFYIAQINSPLNSMILAFGLIKCTLKSPARLPELMNMLTHGWQMGLTTPNLFGVKWEEMWALPLDEVRHQLKIQAIKVAA